ncbi:MAG: type 1 glutamine amidotransferase [Candidatus Thermoplasmatota archaeon]|nr:type 1 glutamine amidotransferase [Candidatus Thermoplasmatota archaeon]
MVDLLVERAAFGHGGNREVLRPFAVRGDVEMLLVTPQMQSFEAGEKSEAGEVPLSEDDVPHWDDEFPFWQSTTVDLEGRKVSFRRIVMPMIENDVKMANWLDSIAVDAVVCSGSRRNVSMWEDWMAPTASLVRASANAGRPTLGICFGHQLLCHALGATIERAESLSSGIWDLDFTDDGGEDELLTSHVSDGSCVAGLFTHQDHVMTVPESCSLLCSTNHNGVTAVRVLAENGDPLPAWGIQFHPEAARARIERAYEWGHITEEELSSFKGEHDGASILSSFATIVGRYQA